MKRIKLTLTFGKCANIELGFLLQYANKKMSNVYYSYKECKWCYENFFFGGTNINEIPSKGSSLSTTPSSHSNLIDDVYIPNVETTLDTRFEMDRLQLYKDWFTRDNVNPFIRDAIQAAYNTTIFDKDNATNT